MSDNLTYFNYLVEIGQAYWGQVENLNDSKYEYEMTKTFLE